MTRDLRLALRSLLRRPALSATTVATLALGIGGATALFSVAWTYALGPSRFVHADRTLVIVERAPDGTTMPVDLPTARDWAAAPSLAAAGVFERDDALLGRDAPAHAPIAYASAGIFSALEATPARGRLFTHGDDDRNAPAVALLSDGAWRRLTGADPHAVGSTLVINGRPHTVVGVLPPSFRFGSRIDVWASLGSWLRVLPADVTTSRQEKSLMFVARVADGATTASATVQLAAICKQIARIDPESPPFTPAVKPLREFLAADTRAGLLMLLAAVGLLLLVACFDLAVLWLVRAYGRQRELAVRRALGGSSTQLLRLLASESLLVCLAGGALGVLAAGLGVGWLERWLPVDLVSDRVLSLEPVAIVAALALAAAVGIVFAALPLMPQRRALASLRSARGSRGGRDSSRAGALLVAGQVAGATALLQVGLLLAGSLLRLLAVDPGFDANRAITASVTLSADDARDGASTAAAWERVLAAVGSTPGVSAAGATTHPPLAPMSQMNVEIEGTTPGRAGQPLITHSSLAGELFAALGTRLVAGRPFAAVDQRPDAEPTVIVNAELARRYWPGQQAVGKRLRWAIPGMPEFPWRRVVGVVANSRDYGVTEEIQPAAFFPYRQLPGFVMPAVCKQMTIVARYGGSTEQGVRALRATLHRTLPSAYVGETQSLAATLRESLATPRLYARSTALFAALALLLAGLGIHGVLAATIEQRRHELGVRLAVGARPQELRALVFGRGLRLALVGAAIGLAAGLAAAHALAALLHGISPADPRALAAVVVGVLLVSLAGCLVPARRAMRTDASRALLAE